MLLSVIHLLDADPAVSQITVDFEIALWSVLRRLFPGVKLLGCAFHWTQALWRKIQALGLQGAYNNDDAVHKYLRKIMALPFLPASKIPRVYRHLRPQAATAPLREFLAYVGDQWVYGSFFSIIFTYTFHIFVDASIRLAFFICCCCAQVTNRIFLCTLLQIRV